MDRHGEIYNSVVKLYRNKKYKEVVDKANKYLNLEYKNDKFAYNMRFMRAVSLRFLSNFDEAISELKELLKIEKDNILCVFELFHIYYFLNRYGEALNLLPKLYSSNNKNFSNTEFSIMEIVIRKQLGLPIKFKKGTRSNYIKNQIVNYNEALAYEHIMLHTHDEYSYSVHSRFNDNTDIKYLMECVKDDLNSSKKINIHDVLEVHHFSVPVIGYDENSICNYIRVIVTPQTKNIITMYPFAYVEEDEAKILNCDIDRLFKRDKKEKTMSRIDKFNKKFNLDK